MKNAVYGHPAECGCARTESFDCGELLPVFAFVPVQTLRCVYEVDHGFRRGTIFPELDKPFLAGGCAR